MAKFLDQLTCKVQHRLRSLPPIIQSVREKRLTYLSKNALRDLYDRVTQLEQRNIPGALIETGCALGGSAIVMAAAKSRSRPFYVYDAFGMIPPPSEADGQDVQDRFEEIQGGQSKGIDGDPYYGYEDDLYTKVLSHFEDAGYVVAENNIHLIKGLFEETLRVDEPVALAHIDGDWYSSVMTSLQQIEPHLVEGGVLVIDDYDAWSGCRKAVDEYFELRKSQYKFQYKSRLHIVKKASARA